MGNTKNNPNTEQGKGNGTHVKNTRKKDGNRNGNGNNSTPEVVSRDGSKLEEGDENQYQHFVISTRAAETTNAEMTINVTAATAAESSLMMLPPIRPSTATIPTATAKTKTKQTIAALSFAAVPKIEKGATKTTTAATILKKKKDPNAPKRNRTAYNYYFTHIMPSIKKDHPYTKEGNGHYSRIIGAKFKKLTDIERKQWDVAAASDKERYHRDMKEYNEKKKKDCCLPVVAAAAVKKLTKTT